MKSRLLIVLGCMGLLLSGCNALDGKCDYIPANPCGCSTNPFDPSYYNCNCKTYAYTQAMSNRTNCGSCKCINDTCNNCWGCGYNYHFNDL